MGETGKKAYFNQQIEFTGRNIQKILLIFVLFGWSGMVQIKCVILRILKPNPLTIVWLVRHNLEHFRVNKLVALFCFSFSFKTQNTHSHTNQITRLVKKKHTHSPNSTLWGAWYDFSEW